MSFYVKKIVHYINMIMKLINRTICKCSLKLEPSKKDVYFKSELEYGGFSNNVSFPNILVLKYVIKV